LGRYTGPKCRLCRREGIKLFLKGTRCDTAKCAIERRQYPPGATAFRRRKITPYGLQLREKQKLKRYYGVAEKQFRLAFARAERTHGNTGENLLLLMERRLDNVVAALGLSLSHSSARQFIRHGHVTVNGRRASIASMIVSAGDEISVVNRDKSKALAAESLTITENQPLPTWLELVSVEPPVGRVVREPTREDVQLPVEEQLVVELLSK
jgi:small subunit ribosomal protein S4